MGSRAVALVCRDAEAAARALRRRGRADRRAVHPHRAAVLRRPGGDRGGPRRLRDGGHRGRAVGGARHGLAAARRRADALVAEGVRAAAHAVRGGRRRRRARSSRARSRPWRRPPARGVDVAGLLARQRERAADAAAFTEAYRRYCWTDRRAGRRAARAVPDPRGPGAQPRRRPARRATGLAGPAGGADDPHAALLQAAPGRLVVDTGDEASVRGRCRLVAGDDRPRAARAWSSSRSQALVRDGKGRLVQPGIKVPRPGVPADHLRSRVHPAGEPGAAALRGSWATSGRSRCASTRWAWRRWTGWPTGSRCGGCTRRSSRCWPWSRSRSTPGCSAAARLRIGAGASPCARGPARTPGRPEVGRPTRPAGPRHRLRARDCRANRRRLPAPDRELSGPFAG